VFENRVQRTIFGYKKYKVTGRWGKLHNDDFKIYMPCQIDQIKEDGMGRVCRMYEDRRVVHATFW
jgi:hypothetical protein